MVNWEDICGSVQHTTQPDDAAISCSLGTMQLPPLHPDSSVALSLLSRHGSDTIHHFAPTIDLLPPQKTSGLELCSTHSGDSSSIPHSIGKRFDLVEYHDMTIRLTTTCIHCQLINITSPDWLSARSKDAAKAASSTAYSNSPIFSDNSDSSTVCYTIRIYDVMLEVTPTSNKPTTILIVSSFIVGGSRQGSNSFSIPSI